MNNSNVLTKVVLAAALAYAGAAATADSLKKGDDCSVTKEVEVKYGHAHTFWVTGLTVDTAVNGLSVECEYSYKDEDGDTCEDSLWASESTETYDGEGNVTGYYVLLTAEDWTYVPTSKKSLKFKCVIDGWYDEEVKANNNFTFGHADGDSSYPGGQSAPINYPVGSAENPKTFSMKTLSATDRKLGSFSCTVLEDGTYTIKTPSLTAGGKYRIGADAEINSFVASDGTNMKDASVIVDDESGATVYEFVAGPATKVCTIVLYSSGTFYYAMLPVLKPSAHDFTDLAIGESAIATPGWLNIPDGYAYDEVVDEQLFRITGYKKGGHYVFRTDGAGTDLLMRLYDSNGNILGENSRVCDGVSEVQLAWTATANYAAGSAVYLGVCENPASIGEGEEPSYDEVQIIAEEVSLQNLTTPIAVVPDGSIRSPADADGAVATEERSLSATEWVNTFVIAARAGTTYRVKGVCDETRGLVLGASVYTVSGTTKKDVTATGYLDPSSSGWLQFTPTVHGNVYIDVFVAEDDYGAGTGLEYGPYVLYASAAGADLGVLTAPMKGAPKDKMGWKILKKNGTAQNGEVFYAAGTSAILPKGDYTLVAQAVTGFNTPSTSGYTTVTVSPGIAPSVADEYKYVDTVDPLDDSPDAKATVPSTTKKYAPTKLAPTATKPATTDRTLWADDDADWYTVAATAGSYYRFSFTEKAGAPAMAVYGPDSWTAECDYILFDDPESSLQICAEKKGTYYLKVSHCEGTNQKDSSYSLEATMANPGMVKFAKTDVSAKDSAAYVDLPVSRSGKDGVVRVKYRTVGVQTDKNDAYYYPTNGVLTWVENDNKGQNIRVRLVPNAGWATNKIVKVVLEPFATDDETFDVYREYPATFDVDKQGKTLDTATINIAAAAKKSPGTIQAVCGDPKKPVFTVTAGKTVEIPFERVLGADGIVGVKVETAKGTANKSGETDFTPVVTQLVWAADSADVNTVNVSTKSVAGDYTGIKTFTLKLTALASAKNDSVQYDKPTIAASTITVNILNDKFADTMANYAKTVTAAANGYTVKEGKAGQWVVDADGSFHAPSKGDLTFAFSTTGKFTYIVDGAEKIFTATAKDKTLAIKTASSFEIVGYELDGEQIALRQGLKYEASFGNEGTVKAANLPGGLKLAQDKVTKEWIVAGVPSKAGIFQTTYTTTVGKTSNDETVCYTVAAQGTSAGTFNGLATTFDTTNGVPTLASVTITAAVGGKLSAKVAIAGKSYSFADTGYAYVTGDPDDPDVPAYVTAELALVQKIGSGKDASTVTNWLYYTVMDVPETDAEGWRSEGEVEIQMAALPDAKGSGFQEDVWYFGKVCRDNSKSGKDGKAAWEAAMAAHAGYYTVALVAPDAMPGEPRGTGYMTMTLDAKGKAKLAGKLADGTAYSGSATAALAGEEDGPSVRVPLFAQKGTSVFGGWLSIKAREDGVPVAEIDSPDTDLVWKNDDPASTRDGEDGFALYLYPVGGWYDTVSNLQRSYLESDLFVDIPEEEDALYEIMDALALTGDYAFVAQPSGQAVDLLGNNLSVEKQVLAKDAAKKLNDWAASVNASNVKLAFKRATGIVSGTFDLWYEGTNAKGTFEQKSVSGLKHEGILLLSRGDDGYLEDDVLTAGFFLAPQTLGKRKWTGSYRFDIKQVHAERTWTDAEPE